jgi:hypothetical protein
MAATTVVNNTNQSLMLDDGTPIGAAHTSTARREGVTLTEADRKRFVDPGHLSVIEAPAAPVATKSQTPQAGANHTSTDKQSNK